MINSLLGLLARLTIGREIVGAMAYVHNALDGHRSEIALGILALVHGLKLAGIIPVATADSIEAALGGILPVVLADKASKVMAIVDKVSPAPVEPPKS